MTKGTYGGGTFGSLWGGGVGLYFDNHGRAYPQLYGGTPRFSFSAGYTPDLEGLLTGTSISGSLGGGPMRCNAGTSGGANGYGIGTPGVGVTQGFGPFDFSQDYSQPWISPVIRDSAAAAGVPSRQNVWEYGYPESGASNVAGDANPQPTSAFKTGTAPVPYATRPQAATGGIPGMIAALTGRDPSNAESFLPPAGGLPGMIQDYLRSRALDRNTNQ